MLALAALSGRSLAVTATALAVTVPSAQAIKNLLGYGRRGRIGMGRYFCLNLKIAPVRKSIAGWYPGLNLLDAPS